MPVGVSSRALGGCPGRCCFCNLKSSSRFEVRCTDKRSNHLLHGLQPPRKEHFPFPGPFMLVGCLLACMFVWIVCFFVCLCVHVGWSVGRSVGWLVGSFWQTERLNGSLRIFRQISEKAQESLADANAVANESLGNMHLVLSVQFQLREASKSSAEYYSTRYTSAQLPKADLLTFWFILFGLVLVMAPKG